AVSTCRRPRRVRPAAAIGRSARGPLPPPPKAARPRARGGRPGATWRADPTGGRLAERDKRIPSPEWAGVHYPERTAAGPASSLCVHQRPEWMRARMANASSPEMQQAPFSAVPAAEGLYDPRFEHDACGVSFVVDVKGRPSRSIVDTAL